MNPEPPPMATWLSRARHELLRRRHLVVHGNVDDLVLWNHRYYGLTDVLAEFLWLHDFQLIGQFSLVDGLTYRDDESRAAARRLTAGPTAPSANGDGPPSGGDQSRQSWSRTPVAPSTSPSAATPAPTGDGAPGQAVTTSTRAERTQSSSDDLRRRIIDRPPAEQRSTAEALATIRRLMLQSQQPCAIVLESIDLIVGPEGHLDNRFATNIAHLRRTLDEAVEIGDVRNSLVFITRDAGGLPAWLRENPNVAMVHAERPGIDERTALLRSRLVEYHRPQGMSDEVALAAAGPLARLTDGMTVRDIQALEVTSTLTGIGPDAPRKLVARHRFGVREDPWEKLDVEKVRTAETILNGRVMGQEPAVRAVADVLVNARVGVDFVAGDADANSRPKGVFFFVGPTGVGKTELAKAVAQLVFEDENAMRRFDMSEFSQEHASERLTGSPPGFVGHEQGGVLTNWILERPFSVVLFDEIEKANPKIFDKFLQIIDDGRLTDGQGRTAYFSHSIVIFTSNLGAGTLTTAHPDTTPDYAFIHEHFSSEVNRFFTERLGRPELLGRLGGGVVVFDILRPPVIRAIAEKFLNQIVDSARSRGYALGLDRDAILQAVVDYVMSTGASLGARPIRDPLLEQWVRIPLNRWILTNSPAPGTQIQIRRTGGHPPFAVE